MVLIQLEVVVTVFLVAAISPEHGAWPSVQQAIHRLALSGVGWARWWEPGAFQGTCLTKGKRTSHIPAPRKVPDATQ